MKKLNVKGDLLSNKVIDAKGEELEKFLLKGKARRGYKATDPNGILVTLLDSDLSQKLVIIDDLNLYFALQQETQLEDNNVIVEILDDLPRTKRWSF